MRWFSAPLVFSLVLSACSNGKSDDTDTDAAGDTDVSADTDETTSQDTDGDTDVSEDTDLAPMLGTPVVLTNGSFEDQGLAAGGGVFQNNGASRAPGLLIPGWTFYLGTAYSGVGVARPNAVSFDAVEPLASPAEGTHVAYLDARGGFAGESSDAHVTHTLSQLVDAGSVIHARMAFGTRLDNDVVSPHSVVKLQLLVDSGIVAETVVTMPAPGSWTDVEVSYEVPSAIGSFTVSAIAYQADMGTVAYWQTYLDNLRVTIE